MSINNEWPATFRELATATINIASSTTVSSSVDLAETSLLAFVAPAAWTTSTLKLQGSNDNVTFFDLYDAYGGAVGSLASVTAGAGYAVDVVAMLPWRYVRFVAGTAQGANRTFTLITRQIQ